MSLVRINQLWPSDLKEEIQAHVGTRQMTVFTLQALREKLERDKAQPEADAPTAEMVDTGLDPYAADWNEPDEAQAQPLAEILIHPQEPQPGVVELPPAAITPIPATVIEIPTVEVVEEPQTQYCAVCMSILDDKRNCWLCGVQR